MKETLDEKDLKILEILMEDSSLSTHKISKKTLIPVTTVLNRIRKLKALGVITRYSLDI
ncbi:winged helix-turn-helix transcriptional regulator [Candidatus Woesearchaeota archaeon]|nr:winged helix-turn-helix transcriptional regulator [Candidatus Woesearchaeota archaeon]